MFCNVLDRQVKCCNSVCLALMVQASQKNIRKQIWKRVTKLGHFTLLINKLSVKPFLLCDDLQITIKLLKKPEIIFFHSDICCVFHGELKKPLCIYFLCVFGMYSVSWEATWGCVLVMRASGSLLRMLYTVCQKNPELISIDCSLCWLLTLSVTFSWLEALYNVCGLNWFRLLIVNCVEWIAVDEWLFYVTICPQECCPF